MQRFCNLLERVIKYNPQLAEAKADAFMKALADKFEKEVAHSSTLRNNVDRSEIEYAIEFFKKFKDSIDVPELKQVKDKLAKDPNSEPLQKRKAELEKELAKERDISNWTIRELLHFLKGKPGYNPPTGEEEKEEEVPPVAYQKDGITVYDGSNEDRCVSVGRGEPWCITKGSFANYRYDKSKKYPTFYLVKDDRVDSEGRRLVPIKDPKSFFVVMVGNDGTYKASDRTNNDIGGRGSEWDKWENWSGVEKHFPSVKGLEQYFKYRKIKQSEMDTKGLHTVEDWALNKNVDKKNQRLISALRNSTSAPFRTEGGGYLNWNTFIKRYLAKPEQRAVADLFVKSTYENPEIFLKNYDYFTPAQQKSIIANVNNPQHPVGITADRLAYDVRDHDIPYEAAVALLRAGKIKPTADTHLYLTGRDNIVWLLMKHDGIDVYTIDKGGVDKKQLTQDTEHYLLSDPNLESIPITKLTKAVEDNNLSDKVLQTALGKEAEGRETLKVGDSTYIIQYNDKGLSVASTKGQRGALPDEVADKVAATIKSDATKRADFIRSFNGSADDQPIFTSQQFQKILGGLSDQERTTTDEDKDVYVDAQPGGIITYTGNFNPNSPRLNTYANVYNSTGGLRGRYGGNIPTAQQYASYDNFIQNVLPPLTTNGVIQFFNNQSYEVERRPAIANAVRLAPDNDYVVKLMQDGVYFVNKVDKNLCKKLNFSSGNIVNLRLSQANYDQILGREAQPRPQRQAATPATAAATPEQPQAAAQGGNVDLIAQLTARGIRVQNIPERVLSRIRQGGQQRAVGADTANRFANIGTVTGYQLEGRASSMFIITIRGTERGIATVHMQPGNIHGVLSSRGWIAATNSGDVPTRVAQAYSTTLQDTQAVQEALNNDKMKDKKELIKKLAEQIMKQAIKENEPAVAPGRPVTLPTTKPTPRPNPLDIPPEKDVETAPKASGKEVKTGKAAEIAKKIIDRAKNI